MEIILVTNGEKEEALPWLSASAELGSQWNDTSPVKTCEKVLRAFNHFQTLILQPIVSNSSELKMEAAGKRTKLLFPETLNRNIGSCIPYRRVEKTSQIFLKRSSFKIKVDRVCNATNCSVGCIKAV